MSNWVETAYREHRDTMVRVAWIVLRDHQLAEDAVHSAVQRLLLHNEPSKNPRGYVLQAVRRAAIDVARKAKRQYAEPLDSNRDTHLKGATDDPAAIDVDDLLSTLDHQKREVVQLKLQVGLTFQEIAGVLNEPMSTISSRYGRAIDELRMVLENSNE